jgi:import receptor subunit TOM70
LIDDVRTLDFTAATILDRFQNASSASAVERVLKVMASEKAKELIAVCAVPLPELICTDRQL